jgi:colanic acid/amylovoran biosynthesis glycosyltransferase
LRVLSVGRLDWAKGYEFALDAVALLRVAGVAVEYTILGEGPYEDAIRFAAHQRGLFRDNTLRLVGAVKREQVAEYYRASDLMLHAAVSEGFCNAVIEAQAAGLPVVTADTGGLPENVADGVTGFVVPRRNPAALAEKMLLLARDPRMRTRMGAAGKRRVQSNFDISHQIQEFVQVYQALTGIPSGSVAHA